MATKKSPGKKKVEKVMHEYKEGELKSGSGDKVTSRKQAVAIALSEAREAGADIPKKAGSKKSAKKSTKKVAKKSIPKKAAPKKAAKKPAKKVTKK